jgi:hypothetical protein
VRTKRDKTLRALSRLVCELPRVLVGPSATATAATPESGKGMLPAALAALAYIASSVSGLVCVEMVEPLLPAPWQGSVVTVMWVEAVIDVAVKPARAVEPWASSKKHPANEPVWPIVPVG